jgi:HAD superfamily hydrolase (TIGR01509 family)
MASRFDTGVIFDFDGTLVDSEPIHLALFQELAAEMGHELDEDEYRIRYRGRTDRDILTELREEAPSPRPVDVLLMRKARLFRQCLGTNAVPPVPGAVTFVHRLARKGFRLAVASSATLDEIRLGLRSLGIYHFFQAVISAESVSFGKPSPEPYIAAAALLGFRPGQCVAYEDSISGVKSAADAGVMVTAVGPTPRALTREAGATDMIADFTSHALPQEQAYGYLQGQTSSYGLLRRSMVTVWG